MMRTHRCAWVTDDPLYIAYHDHEWGKPVHEDRKLFEMISLEGAQAGLSWITIIKRRENYRAAFDNFETESVSKYNEDKIQALHVDGGMIHKNDKDSNVSTTQYVV